MNTYSQEYYVYFYLRPDFTPYYVGKGKGHRAYIKGKGQIPLPKNKSRILLVNENLTELQAFILERYYIRWFGRKDNDTGILRNRTDGGEGCSNRKISEETKNKISKSNTGKKASDQTKNKMSLAKLGKPSWNKNKKMNYSPDHLQNLKSNGIKTRFMPKQYYVLNLENNSIILIDNLKEYCNQINIGYSAAMQNSNKNKDKFKYITNEKYQFMKKNNATSEELNKISEFYQNNV